MAANLVETLPWIDYSEVFAKIEERGEEYGRKLGEEYGIKLGEERGEAHGKQARDLELALNAYATWKLPHSAIYENLHAQGIAESTIEAARQRHENHLAPQHA
jgi:predicted transposase YdaD